MDEEAEVVLQVLDWSIKDDDDLGCVIYATGISDSDGVSDVLRVTGFHPWCQLELPAGHSWDKERAKAAVVAYLKQESMVYCKETKEYQARWKIVDYRLAKRKSLRGRREGWYLQLWFQTLEELKGKRGFVNWVHNNQHYFANHRWPKGELKVHEHNIDLVIHFTDAKKIQLAGWIKAREVERLECDTVGVRYWQAHHTHVCGYEQSEPRWPKYLSFDGEMYSHNHMSKRPNPYDADNCIFHIGVVLGRVECEGKRFVLLTLGDPLDCSQVEPLSKEGYMRAKDYRDVVHTIRCVSEKQLLIQFFALIERENPDIFVHYNGLKFDWEYILVRASMLGVIGRAWKLSRIPDLPGFEGRISWASKAYGSQECKYISLPGRINVDVLIEVQRNYRLHGYSLDVVSEYFLGEKKEDVSPSQLFLTWNFWNKHQEHISLSTLHKELDTLFPPHRTFGFLLDAKRRIRECSSLDQVHHIAREILTVTGYYCVIDTVLPLDLMAKLSLWINMRAMSNIMGVPLTYLHTRGQQIKVLARIYSVSKEEGLVVPFNEKKDIVDRKYCGAIVIEAHRGFYEMLDLYDFESLYPSEMIAQNVCLTTFVEPDEDVPDCECNIVQIETHKGCEHDTSGKKVKKDDITCQSFRHKFRKVRIIRTDKGFEIDGEGVLPKLERRLLAERRLVKKEMAKLELRLKMHTGEATDQDICYARSQGWEVIRKGSLSEPEARGLKADVKIRNAEQLAIKILCNSVYGSTGAQMGYVYHIAVAESITGAGREHLIKSANYIRERFGGKVVYGDSVVETTPILVRHCGKVMYTLIRNLFTPEWGVDRQDKERYIPQDLEVWSDMGWTRVKTVIRHKTDKQVYRVLTHTGCVDVTEDHSLVRPDGTEISPLDVELGQQLLHSSLPNVEGEYSETVLMAEHMVRTEGYCIKSCLAAAMAMHCGQLLGLHLELKQGKEEGTWTVERHDQPVQPTIKTVQCLGSANGAWVYDLETENHHFAAGVGHLIVHNTDSNIVTYNNDGLSFGDMFDRAAKIVKAVTHYLKCDLLGIAEDAELTPEIKFLYDMLPINLQHESTFSKLLLLAKKMYMAHIINRDGKLIGKLKKGVLTARRDNCELARRVYDSVSDMLFDTATIQQVEERVAEWASKMFRGEIPEKEYVVRKGIDKMSKYAAKDEKENLYGIKYDEYGERVGQGMICTTTNPLDWWYGADGVWLKKVPAHVVLALKMLERGEDVPSNTRMEYLFLVTDKDRRVEKQHDKIEDLTYYIENKGIKALSIDNNYYLLKQLAKPISKLLLTKFGTRPTLPPLEKRLLPCFETLPSKCKMLLDKKRGVRQQALLLINIDLEQFVVEQGELAQDGETTTVARKRVLHPRVAQARELALAWWSAEILDFARFRHGVGKCVYRCKKDFHPIMSGILEARLHYTETCRELVQLWDEVRADAGYVETATGCCSP